MTQIRLLLTDDHPVMRAGLRALLEFEPDFVVVDDVATAEAAVQRIRRGDIDVVLMDLQFGRGMGGSPATWQITIESNAPRVIVLTTYDTEADITAVVEAGASGCLLKDAPPRELVAAVRAAAAGQTTLAPTITSLLNERMRAPARSLSTRESEVLSLVVDGLSIQQIAQRLFVSQATIKSHLVHIFTKLDAGRAQRRRRRRNPTRPHQRSPLARHSRSTWAAHFANDGGTSSGPGRHRAGA